MSDADDDNFQFYGTLLEPYDEDEIPKKKAFSIEDQIATDDQGRRRFHGAFTGGFSAGFFNTVGSLEGWKPSEFKSSRSEKAEKMLQKPQDFMDDEDMGQFGIAPSVVRATNDYSTIVKPKKRILNTDGPIPGVPVLHTILEPAKDTVGIKLLKRMGWKPGQGIGPRVSKSEKQRMNRENNKQKVYGCEIPREIHSESSEDDDVEITFAPDDYDPFIFTPKDNTFGMGYTGLDKRPILSSHINLFNPPEFKMQDYKNSKISIAGQAFGVGAFENEDEDIYNRDDMSKYDFELDPIIKQKKKLKTNKKINDNVLEGFVLATNSLLMKKSYPPPVLPQNFIPKHGARLSRFEPLPEQHAMYNYDRLKTAGRHDLTANQRSKILNSTPEILTSNSEQKQQKTEKEVLKEKALKITSDLPAANIGPFKPFSSNPEKQKRYEEYLTLIKINQTEKLIDLQPASMSKWEQEREKFEFSQAARMFKPVAGLVFDKFVAASTSDDHVDPLQDVGKSVYEQGTLEMREAAKKKMFGPLTRTIEIWKPNKLLCKRFNVSEPDVSETELALSKRKKNKYSVFDYYEAHQQNKVIKEGPEPKKIENQTPVEEPKQIIEENPLDPKTENVLLNKYITPPSPKKIPEIPVEIPKILEAKVEEIQIKEPEVIIPALPTDPKEKIDLFKAIFLSSDESEEEDETKPEEKLLAMKKIVLEDENKPEKLMETKKIVLEEEKKTEPEKSTKPNKGIFADLDWNQINKKTQPVQEKLEENLFGPKIPKPTIWKPKIASEKVVKDNHSTSSSEDEWMEADLITNKADKSRKKNKKDKKHKSDKNKQKKHKSKHKKKKNRH